MLVLLFLLSQEQRYESLLHYRVFGKNCTLTVVCTYDSQQKTAEISVWASSLAEPCYGSAG